MSEGKGHFLCGAVNFIAKNLECNVEACHCGMCRRWGGGPFMCVECGTDVTFEGEESIAVYNSSEWAQRGFCKECGSHLFYRLKDSNEYQLSAGLFDHPENFDFDLQVFTDKKPAFYSFSNETREMTEAEVIEKFAPDQLT